jgi:single-strand DNA-binding protein
MSINFSDVVRIGKDAVTRYTSNSKAVTGFSAAVDSGFGDNKKTIWLDCSAWGERWEKVAPYLLKGSQAFVQGELGTREHDGKTYITVDVKELKLIGGKPNGERQDSAPRQQRQAAAPAGDASNGFPDDDDIPFAPIPRRAYY